MYLPEKDLVLKIYHSCSRLRIRRRFRAEDFGDWKSGDLMGEAVLSCEGDEMEMGMEMDEVEVCDGRMVKRERFSPRMALRVLLVEADDSTRQVIAALLRKCSYKVAAVSDGLKAWEVLKGKPNSVDLILTEVELPSISGFALLTLIMEHDSCKNIPVIMMSSNDSVNMVYKCMLRGAADFLVKPVRKNELQNLWQHVWRRQSQKAEGLSDNDVLIDLSNGACTPENEECNEKGNDAQSSCSVRDLEAESAYTETMQGNLKANFSKLASCDSESDEEERVRGDPATLEPACVVIGSSFEAPEDAVMMIQQEDHGGKKHGEASDNNDAFINGSREAIDLIGNFQDHSSKSNINSSVITCSTKFDFCPRLDLSLRRYDDSKGSQYIAAEERRQAVHQSTASAFSRYVAMQPSSSHNTRENTTSHQPGEEHGAISDKHISSPVQPSNFDVYDGATELRQGETSFYCPQARMLPVTVPVKSVRLDRTCPSNGSSLRPSYYQTGSSPDSSGPRDNGGLNRLNSSGGGGSACGSNGSGNGNPTTESKADGISTQDRSLQREAALTKFRQKRKDRCFEKKVRYESRKKLAEQRPRVKGQFVRQVPADLSSAAAVDTR